MEWRCEACGRAHDEDPGTCACGSANVAPRTDADRSRFSLGAVRDRLLDPAEADRSLVQENAYLTLAFRLVVVLAVLFAVAYLLRLLVAA